MSLGDYLDRWSNKPGMQRLSLNKAGICVVKMSAHYYLSFEESSDENGFYLYSVICKIDPKANSQWALEALEGNLFGRETGENSLGFDSATKTLVLFKYLSYESTSYQLFCDHIDEFSAYRNYWEKKIKKSMNEPNSEKLKGVSESLLESIHEKKIDIFFA